MSDSCRWEGLDWLLCDLRHVWFLSPPDHGGTGSTTEACCRGPTSSGGKWSPVARRAAHTVCTTPLPPFPLHTYPNCALYSLFSVFYMYVLGEHYHRITLCATLSICLYGQNSFKSNQIKNQTPCPSHPTGPSGVLHPEPVCSESACASGLWRCFPARRQDHIFPPHAPKVGYSCVCNQPP